MPNNHQQLAEEFEAWVKQYDPHGHLTKEQQAQCFLELREQAGKSGDCNIEMGLVATNPDSTNELNAFLKLAGFKDKLAVGQGIKMFYKINLGLDGLVPSSHGGLLKMLEFLTAHPDSLLVGHEDEDKLLDSLDQWVAEAEAWHELVAKVRQSFNKVFMLNAVAVNKAVNGANKNEVMIE